MNALSPFPAWAALKAHRRALGGLSMRALFADDSGRFARFSLRLDDLLVDYSKHRIVPETMRLLVDLARQGGVEDWRARMVAGEPINSTEGRAVLHMALRARPGTRMIGPGGEDAVAAAQAVKARLARFVAAVHDGHHRGATGKPIASVINIGIGGSDLGPAMATEVLAAYRRPGLAVHFVSNVDGADIAQALARCDPATTLVVVASKTFTTQETLANARAARAWLTAVLGEAAVARHFVALSTNRAAVEAFGIAPERMFEFWDWVGGRYSVWSAIGLSLALAIGMEHFERFLAGARAMDAHFLGAPLAENMPVVLALLGIWYVDCWGAQAHAVLPYAQALRRLPAYLQQLEMESNGKAVTRDGRPVRQPTAPVIFGEPGTNGQHAFFQALHQGTLLVPADFIAAAETPHPIDEQHAMLLANCLAQSEALMRGRTRAEARARLRKAGLKGAALAARLPHTVFPGNRPSTTILMRSLDPFALGRLLALYEHKVFVQGAI
ncbi:MAG: glucose-6-phosphate isomerase, partial [Alphaproteobacteria bacterium]|nr:glucose-6-phosphate isomerase [Alphaproteobacteria bacterium]